MILPQVYFDSEKPYHFLKVKIIGDSSKFLSRNMLASCDYEYDTNPKRANKGLLVFRESHFTLPIIVHECTHAAMCFAQDLIMSSPAVRKLPKKKQMAHYEELVPTLTEALFKQVSHLYYVHNNTTITSHP